MLFGRGRLKAGQTVMINAVGSGIGSAGVQLASHAGAFVIGNASSQEKLDRATELGMDVGINRLDENIAERVMEVTDGVGADLVFEHVGGEMFQASMDSLMKDGAILANTGHFNAEINIPALKKLSRKMSRIKKGYLPLFFA